MIIVTIILSLDKTSKRKYQRDTEYVTVFLMGGLCNQLFEIGTGLSYAERTKKTFIMDTYAEKVGDRPTYYKSFFDGMVQHGTTNDKKWITTKEKGFHYTEIGEFNGNVSLSGFYQSYRYISPSVRQRFSDALPFLKPVWTGTSVSLHVRRTDYMGGPFDQTGLDYYVRAINYMTKNIQDFTIIVFSDDIEYCKETFPTLVTNVSFQFISDTYTDIESLALMRSTDHHILTNSTFSVWGTFLDDNWENSIIIMPHVWFNDDRIYDDIYFPNAIKM